MSTRRWAHRAALVAPPLLLTLLAILAIEAWVRFERFGIAGIVDPYAYPPPAYRPVDCIKAGPDGELMTPDCSMRYKGADIVTNSRGLNDREVDEDAPHYRIVVLGDSVSMAAGVDPREIYHAVLEDRLNAELGTPGFVELYNFGRGGRNTAQQMTDLLGALAFGPVDGVLVAAVPSDYVENTVRTDTCAVSDHLLIASEADREFFRRIVQGINPVSHVLMLVESRTGLWSVHLLRQQGRRIARRWRARPEHGSMMEAIEARAHQRFRSCAARIRGIADDAGIDLAWVLLWYRPHPHADAMLGILDGLDEPVTSLLDVHEQFAGPETMYIFKGDEHPNADVQGVFADRVYGYLEELGWLERIRAAHAERVGDRRPEDPGPG